MVIVVVNFNGCILGPDVEGVPQEQLWPPIIVMDQVEPSEVREGFTEVLPGDQCSMKKFRIGQVLDKNTSDVLYTRWFVDWSGRDGSEFPITSGVVQPNGGSEIRNAGDIFNKQALEFEFLVNQYVSDFHEGAVHTITFVIGDRVLGEKNISFVDTQDGAQGQFDIFQWNVKFTSAGLCDEEVFQ